MSRSKKLDAALIKDSLGYGAIIVGAGTFFVAGALLVTPLSELFGGSETYWGGIREKTGQFPPIQMSNTDALIASIRQLLYVGLLIQASFIGIGIWIAGIMLNLMHSMKDALEDKS